MPPKRTNKKLAKENDLDESEVREAREAFDLIANDSPTIPITSVRSAMSALGLTLSPEESKSIHTHLLSSLASAPASAAGVPFEMFLEVVAVKMSDRDKSSEVDRAFELFDPKETGRITIHELKRVAKLLGEDIKDSDLVDMLQEAGDASGISKSQFEQVMSRAGIW